MANIKEKLEELKGAADYARHNGGFVQIGHDVLNDLLDIWKKYHEPHLPSPVPPQTEKTDDPPGA